MMKKIFTKSWFKAACVAVLGLMSMNASAEVSFSPTEISQGSVKDLVTLTNSGQVVNFGTEVDFYENASVTFSVPSNFKITQISVTPYSYSGYWKFSVNAGYLSSYTWYPNNGEDVQSMTMTSTGYSSIKGATVYYEEMKEPEPEPEPMPSLNGTPQVVTLPYLNQFETDEEKENLLGIDANEDNYYFTLGNDEGNGILVLNTNSPLSVNDYVVICAANLTEGKRYNVSFKGKSPQGGWHYSGIVAGTEATSAGLNQTVLGMAMIYSTGWDTFDQPEFVAPSTDTYYFAVKCWSNPNTGDLYVDDFAIEPVADNMPTAVESVNVEAGENGALTAAISFAMPTTTYGGEDYPSDKQLTYHIYRCYSSWGDEIEAYDSEIATGTATVGDNVNYVDNSPENGENYYGVVITDGALTSKAKKVRSPYIGYDIPNSPTNVQMSVNGNQITLTWNAVTTGENNGYLGDVTYDVYPSMNYTVGAVLNDSPITDTTYSFDYDLTSGEQGEVKFVVKAVSAGGSSYNAYTSTSILAGVPYELPFVEDFTSSSTRYSTQASSGSGSGAYWGGETYIGSYSAGASVDLITGKINLNNRAASVSVGYRAENSSTTIEIIALDAVGTEHILETITNPANNYQTYTGVIPAAIANTDWIRLIVRATFENWNQYAYVNSIVIETASTDIAVSAAGYATYYNSAKAYTMPAGLTGYVVTPALQLAAEYEAGDVVPAGEPLVLQGAAGEYELEYAESSEWPLKSSLENLLDGTDAEETTPVSLYSFYNGGSDPANCYFFGLTLNAASDLNSAGFYYMNATGAAFTNGAHKAYLCLPKTMLDGVAAGQFRGWSFAEMENGLETAISLTPSLSEGEGACYDLYGRRTNGKGLILQNGKVVLVK